MVDKKKMESKIRINKVYTKKGDLGKTTLVGGHLVYKDDLRINAYGTVDELQSIVGACIVYFNKIKFNISLKNDINKIFIRIQNELFNLGSSLGRLSDDVNVNTPKIIIDNIKKLENEIDYFNKDLPELKSFVLPGGSEINVWFHMARTVCRRAERKCITLSKKNKIDENIIPYLNRLSDHFFVFSRWISNKIGTKENLWDLPL